MLPWPWEPPGQPSAASPGRRPPRDRFSARGNLGPSQEREGRGLPSSLGPGTESGHCPPGSAPGASGQGLEQTAVLPTEGWKGEPGKPAGCEQISPQRMLGTGLTRGAPCGSWTRGLGRRGRGAAESEGRTSSRAWQMGCGAREPGPGFQAWGQDSWGQIDHFTGIKSNKLNILQPYLILPAEQFLRKITFVFVHRHSISNLQRMFISLT